VPHFSCVLCARSGDFDFLSRIFLVVNYSHRLIANHPALLYDFPRHPPSAPVVRNEDQGMKILGTIVISFLAIVTSLLVLLSSTCVVARGVDVGMRIWGAIFAALFLVATVALFKQIARTIRNS
jgi:hypothetical protein